jgi:hypothetical protein
MPQEENYRPVVERDEGLFCIGLGDDAAGPFPTRAFALRVADGHPPEPAPVAKFRRIKIEVSSHAS